MSHHSELHAYIAQLQRRLRVAATVRGSALLAVTALSGTLLLALLLNRYAFPSHAVTQARWVLMTCLAITTAIGILWPLLAATRAHSVRRAEALHPELEQRLTTFFERDATSSNPFLELLAADTLTRARISAPASSLAPTAHLTMFAAANLACLVLLVWLVISGPGFLGYGASLLWRGTDTHAAPLYALSLLPGDVTVRRHSDQMISARVTGLKPAKVQLFARFHSSSAWEPVTMEPQTDANGPASFQFVFAGLPEDVEYYVAAGPLVSSHHTIRVLDLPSVKAIHVTYHYPAWTGLSPVSEDHAGDLRAIEGTDATLHIEMDRPVEGAQLALNSGSPVGLTGMNGNVYTATLHMDRDGAYHISGTDAGQPVRLSEDYFIATEKPEPPHVAIARPGSDYRASPIEEVTVNVKADDLFGLRDVRLHYSVNGGSDHAVGLLNQPGARNSDGNYMLALEDFKLVPGDLVSVYATARNGLQEARTDIKFIQAEPFEREFSQSQQSSNGGAGGGGGQNNQTDISRREKELIATTWKQLNGKDVSAKDAAASGLFLSDAQSKLRDQVLALSARMRTRDLSQANEEFTDFDRDMQMAAESMAPSAEKLKSSDWNAALPLEQKALQALLRAEATFRKIEVAFGRQGGGGGGGGNAGRDLASLFDLELDTEKNQYETAQTASPAEQHEKDVESALEKLDALAKRQEDLADRQPTPQQSFQQRWQQEMLRREAEQLQRQLEQLAQNPQTQQGNDGTPDTPSSSSSSSSQSSRTGGPNSPRNAGGSSSDQRIEDALQRVREASSAMRGSGGSQPDTQAARQAAERLHAAESALASSQQHLASDRVAALSQQADRLTQQERVQAERIDKLAATQSGADGLDDSSLAQHMKDRSQLAAERQGLSDALSSLQRDLRDAARSTASTQPGVSQQLRDALTQMDQSDLDNHVQRTADWLRRGINPNSNGTEKEIAEGLQHLDQQLRSAQRSAQQGGSSQQRGTSTEDQAAALRQVERLRSELQAMGRSSGDGDSRPGENTQRNPGALSRRGEPSGTTGVGNGARDRGGLSGTQGGATASGDIRNGGGGGADGTAWGNVNTGNNQYVAGARRSVPLDASGNPADTERTYRQGLRELQQLRSMVQDDPATAKQVQDLTRQMQRVDPSRFPGNPALVEQMHQDVLSAVDRLELQLTRASTSDARTGKSDPIPAGYADSVADYYRRLSASPAVSTSR